MKNSIASQQNNETVPVLADLVLPAALSERLNKLPHESRHLMPDDIIFILSRGPGAVDPEFTRQDVNWCRERAWLALSYAAQLEAQVSERC